ncbi:hypothetical protein U1Q18_044784 [Sarracenia purpurea var. burkii]
MNASDFESDPEGSESWPYSNPISRRTLFKLRNAKMSFQKGSFLASDQSGKQSAAFCGAILTSFGSVEPPEAEKAGDQYLRQNLLTARLTTHHCAYRRLRLLDALAASDLASDASDAGIAGNTRREPRLGTGWRVTEGGARVAGFFVCKACRCTCDAPGWHKRDHHAPNEDVLRCSGNPNPSKSLAAHKKRLERARRIGAMAELFGWQAVSVSSLTFKRFDQVALSLIRSARVGQLGAGSAGSQYIES